MFNFEPNYDISYETLKTTLSSLEVTKEPKYEHGYSWPLFKKWIKARLLTAVNLDGFDHDGFLLASSTNHSPPRFSTLMAALIKNRFSDTFLADYDDEFDGILLFMALNRDFSILTNFDRVKLLKNFLFNLKNIVGNSKSLKSQMAIMSHYFPELAGLSSTVALFALSDPEIARYLRSFNIHAKSEENIQALKQINYMSVLREIKQLKKEGIIASTNEASNDVHLAESSEEAYVVMAKVRCFSCKKWGHFSKNCPLKKRKFQEVQLVEVPLDAEIIVTNDEVNEELYYIELEQLESGEQIVESTKSVNVPLLSKRIVSSDPTDPISSKVKSVKEFRSICPLSDKEKFTTSVINSDTLFKGLSELSLNDSTDTSLLVLNSYGRKTETFSKTDKFNDTINSNECCEEEIYFLDAHQDVEFVVDSGATIHVTNDSSLLSNSRNGTTLIKGVNGSSTATIEGDISLGKLYLKNVLYIAQAPRNIISVHQLTLEGYDVQIDHEKLTITKGNSVICICSRFNNLWILTPKDVSEQMVFVVESLLSKDDILKQHVNHGHASKKQLKNILGEKFNDSAVSKALKECQTCASVVPKTQLKKLHKQEFDVGEMICADLIGPINNSYGLIISDRKSKFAIARVLRYKSEVSSKTLEILKTFKNLLSLTKRTVVIFRADNEFDTKMLGSYCDEEGITTQFSAPHSSFQNGFAETQNREVERKLKLMLIDSNIPNSYWNFAFHHSVFINNYVPRNNDTQSAWEIFRDCKKTVSNILPFGCRIYAFNHDTRQKIQKRDIRGVFLGYHKSTKIAFVLEENSNRIIRSSSFTGMDSVFPLSLDSLNESSTDQLSTIGISDGLSETSGSNSALDTIVPETTINGDDDTIMKEDIVEDKEDSDVELTSANTTDTEAPQFDTSTPLPDEFPRLKSRSVQPTKMLVQRATDSDMLILKPVVTPVSRRVAQSLKRRVSYSPDPMNLLVPHKIAKQLRLLIRTKPREPIDQATSSQVDQIEDGNMSSRKLLEYSTLDSSDEEEAHLLVSKSKYLIPTTFEEALQSPQKAQWLAACAEELMAMKNNDVYEIVPKSNVTDKTVRGRWVFAVKDEPTGDRFKARLVAKGFSQIKGENFVDVYAPVMSFDTLRFVLAVASIRHWSIAQLDAKNAFLNGAIDYDVHFQPPSGCNTPPGQCWKLKRGLYGLKQAPHIWFNTMSKVLVDSGYKQSVLEPCLFYKNDLLLVVYVDDILITGKTEDIINDTKRMLQLKFVMKDLGHPDVFLGITIKETSNGVKLSLSNFISKIANDYEITKEKIISTPLVKGFNASETTTRELTEDEHLKYRSIVGVLLFVANTVRLDISFATSLLSRYLVTPRIIHLKAAYRVLQYIVQTKEFGIEYSPNGQIVDFKDFRYLDKTKAVKIDDYGAQSPFFVTVLSDSDFAADLKDRHSQSGSCTYLNNNLISWSSRKQTCVSLSSTESEYVAMAESAKSGLYFNNLLKEISFPTSYINLCGDNLSALTLSAHKAVHQKTKHIDVKYHFLRSLVTNRDVKLNYVNTKFNIADILTKIVDTTTFSSLISLILASTGIKVTQSLN